MASPTKNSVEKIYQKKTQLEHILLRPDTYIGSVEPVIQVTLFEIFSFVDFKNTFIFFYSNWNLK